MSFEAKERNEIDRNERTNEQKKRQRQQMDRDQLAMARPRGAGAGKDESTGSLRLLNRTSGSRTFCSTLLSGRNQALVKFMKC